MATEKEIQTKNYSVQGEELTCEDKLQQMEEFIEKALSAPKMLGVIKAGPEGPERLYRVEVKGADTLLVLNPKLKEVEKFKPGVSVMVTDLFIVNELPETLELKPTPPDFTHIQWNEIGGMKSQIEKIRDAVEMPLKYEKLYKEFNLSPVKGLLLSGPPGCGKTMIAKAIASQILKELDTVRSESFIYLKGGEMLAPYVGVAENNIKSVFDASRKHYIETGYRSVIFIDEAEAIMPTRGSMISSDVNKSIVPTFLAEMDGFSDNNPFVILATNFPENIDPAIRRAGRIDLVISVERPNFHDAQEIFEIYLNKTKTVQNITELANLATELTFENARLRKNISGALISNIVSRAINFAIKRKISNPKLQTGVCLQDLQLAIESSNE